MHTWNCCILPYQVMCLFACIYGQHLRDNAVKICAWDRRRIMPKYIYSVPYIFFLSRCLLRLFFLFLQLLFFVSISRFSCLFFRLGIIFLVSTLLPFFFFFHRFCFPRMVFVRSFFILLYFCLVFCVCMLGFCRRWPCLGRLSTSAGDREAARVAVLGESSR